MNVVDKAAVDIEGKTEKDLVCDMELGVFTTRKRESKVSSGTH
jgi:hypothetical protein